MDKIFLSCLDKTKVLKDLSRCLSSAVPVFKLPKEAKLNKIAIRDSYGSHSYGDLQVKSGRIASALKSAIKGQNLGRNVAFLSDNNHHYVLAQFGIWKSGQACVPLCKAHPPESLKYYLEDSKSVAVITTSQFKDTVSSIKFL